MNGSSTEYASLIFLHLSDIHFRKGVAGGVADYDDDIRLQLENDLRELVKTLGRVDGVLVTGDIAFSGSADEYKFAQDWLIGLTKIAECDPPIILCVPGNHDVNQSIYQTDLFLRNALEKLQACSTDEALNAELLAIFSDSRGEEIIYKPIQNYNFFASQHGCEITSKEPAWLKEFALAGGPLVRIVGLNSTLGSFHGDKRALNLFVGLKQLAIRNHPPGFNVSLCHHPPEWLKDYDQTEIYLGNRVSLQLFGHKHLHRLSNIDGNLRVSAGAVHPSRAENGWLPRYNLLRIEPNTADSLTVSVYPRVWHEDRFGPDFNVCEGEEFVEHKFHINGLGKDEKKDASPEEETTMEAVMISESTEKMILETSQMVEDKNITNSDFNYGQIRLRRFIGLDEFKRNEIVRRLDLDKPTLVHTSGADMFKEIFERVIERNIFESFWEAVEREHADNLFVMNPFIGRKSDDN